jgi:redox-sensitive bicupin YhaK (pirin superfamily)
MSDLTRLGIERCPSDAAGTPTIQVLRGHQTDLGGLVVRRLLPRSARRLVGAWCFLDLYGPTPAGSPPMDVPPHPHIGLQTVSWVLSGEVHHMDSLGARAVARPGALNLMTAGRGIAHAEVTPPGAPGPLAGIQLWVALPDAHRNRAPSFDAHDDLPAADLPGGRALVFMGDLAGVRSPAKTFSPIVGADVEGRPRQRLAVPVEPALEHALVLLGGEATLEGQAMAPDSLYYLGTGRSEVAVQGGTQAPRLLLLGGEPFGETVLMWWNFVARTADEIRGARDDWQAGRRFGEVRAYEGDRLDAPPFVGRPVPANPAS